MLRFCKRASYGFLEAFDHVHTWPEYTVVISCSGTTACRRKLQLMLNDTCSTLMSSSVVLEEKDGKVSVCLVHSDHTCVLSFIRIES